MNAPPGEMPRWTASSLLLLSLVSLQAAEALLSPGWPHVLALTSRHAAGVSRVVHLSASAEDGVVAELEVRLGRQLTPVEVALAHEAVESALNGLEARLGQSAPRRLEVKDVGAGEETAGTPSDGAARAAASWGSWRNRAPTDSKATARHILVDSEHEALSLLKKLAFGADFETLATEHSLCPSKDKGGALGVFAPGDMAQEFSSFVFDQSSPLGTPLGPVKTPFGYHVVVIDERTP